MKAELITVRAGASTTSAPVGGTLHSDEVTYQVTGTTEQDLKVFSVPADTLDAIGDRIILKVCGLISNHVDTVIIRIKFGATTLHTITISSGANSKWIAEVHVIKDAANSIKYWARSWDTVNKGQINFGSAAPTLTGANDLKVTSQNGVASQWTQEWDFLCTFIPDE